MIKKKELLKALRKLLNSRKRVATIVVLTILAGFIGWRTISSNKDEKTQLQTAQVERGMIISSVSASGQVLSVNIMSANTKASGTVKTVFVKDGDQVKKGDKILEIDLDLQGQQKYTQAWSSYLSAKNTLESAKAAQYGLQADMFGKWDTFKELAETDEYDESHIENRNLPEFHIPEKEWLAAEIKYKNQAAIISQAQVAANSNWLSYQLTSPVITAPTDGTITSLMFAEGMSIGALDTGNTTSNQKVATIKTEGTPIVSVNLSEIDVSRVKINQKATTILDSIPDKTFTGKVIGIDRIGQTTSGVTQYSTIIQLDSSSAEILPNMTVTANIIIERKDNALLVPSGSIQSQGGQNFIIVLENAQQQSVPVVIGLTSDTQTEIISGLNEDDVVVTAAVSKNSGQDGDSPFGTSGMKMMRISH